jgi:hypothetical protein
VPAPVRRAENAQPSIGLLFGKVFDTSGSAELMAAAGLDSAHGFIKSQPLTIASSARCHYNEQQLL